MTNHFVIREMSAIVSWSGGKDSCLALWRTQKQGKLRVIGILSALDETGLKARSHGVTKELIQAQAASIGVEPFFISASWKTYEEEFIKTLGDISASRNVAHAVFGDIDLVPHKEWEDKVCAKVGVTAHLPLWEESRLDLVNEFLNAGFKARVVCVDGGKLDESFVGREFDKEYVASLPPGVDACGENGEFHTFVYDGPNFKTPVKFKSLGKQTYTAPPEYGSQKFYFDFLDVEK